MSDHCIHGELDAVCRACCDPLTVDWPDDWAHEQRQRAGLVAAVSLLVLAVGAVLAVMVWQR